MNKSYTSGEPYATCMVTVLSAPGQAPQQSSMFERVGDWRTQNSHKDIPTVFKAFIRVVIYPATWSPSLLHEKHPTIQLIIITVQLFVLHTRHVFSQNSQMPSCRKISPIKDSNFQFVTQWKVPLWDALFSSSAFSKHQLKQRTMINQV